MSNHTNRMMSSRYWWVLLLLILIGINYLASVFHSRFDLTKENRYTISKPTKDLLRGLNETVTIDVFLKGEFPAGFRKLANGVREFMDELKEYGRGNLVVNFIDPLEGLNDTTARYFIDSMRYYYEISPYTINAPSKVGDELTIKQVLPGALVRYRDTIIGVNLLKGVRGYGTEPEQLASLYNDVEATLEYKFGSAIEKIVSEKRPLVGYALGHGEGWGFNVDDAVRTLIKNYRFDTVNISTIPYIPTQFNAVVILKPTKKFTDADKLKIDQYVMNGGRIFWMIDNMFAEFDSLRNSEGFVAFDRGLDLEDILFRYGVRINQNLLQDMQADKLGQMSSDPNNPQTRLVDWPFFPILNGTNHPISKNLDGVRSMFPNTIDTVKADGIKKTYLLKSSPNARILQAPAKIDFEFLQIAPDIRQFTTKDTPVAVLLEGKFQSLFKGRISRAASDSLKAYNMPYRDQSDENGKMIVVADGDIAVNEVSQQYGPLPMGFNFYTQYTYANSDFYVNALEYLTNPSGILETRSKDFTLRLLDPVKVRDQKTLWQFINIAVPVILIILFGLFYQFLRKRKYSL